MRPPGLLSDVNLNVSMSLASDGRTLTLTGDGDESQTRWLLPLDGSPDEWIEIPSSNNGQGAGFVYFIPGTGD